MGTIVRNAAVQRINLGGILSGYVPYVGATTDLNLGIYSLIAAEVLTDTVIAENLYFNSVPFDSLICTSLTSGLLTNVQMGNNMSFFEGTLSVTNAALTRVNDTNVTLTLGGGANSAVLAATSMTLGWTGQLGLSRGGTNANLTAVNGGVVYSTASAMAITAAGTTGQILKSNGAAAPTWVDLSTLGVSSITGTANQITASASIGAVTLSLPSAIITPGTLAINSMTTGSVFFSGASSVVSQDNSNFFWDNTNKYLAIGLNTPAAQLHIGSNSLATSILQTSSAIFGSRSRFRRSNGTIASPSNVVDPDTDLGAIYFDAYRAGAWQGVAAMLVTLDGTPSDTSLPTSYQWLSASSGSISATPKMQLTSNGTLNINTIIPTVNAMGSGTSLIQTNVKLMTGYNSSAGVNNYFLGSGNDGGLLQVFGCSNTLASPTAITTGGRLGGFFGRGYATTGYSNAIAAIEYYAESTFSDTSTPSYIQFSTCASSATTRREILRINSAGSLLFADGNTDAIGFRGSIGSYSIQYYNDGSRYPLRFVGASDAGTPRWFEFGNYTSDTYGGTWNAKVSINSVTAYTTIGTVATGPWPVSTTYALFGNTALDQTNAGNYSIVVSAGGELNLNRPTSQNIYMRENNGATSQLTVLTGGKVGINVNSPANYLDAWNNANSAVYNEVTRFVVTNNSFGTNYSRLTIGQVTTNVMFIEAANQSNTKGSLALQPYGGSVGIGCTPASIFHINQISGAAVAIVGSNDGGANNDTLQFRSAYSGLANPSDITASIIGAPSNAGGRLIFNTSQNTTGTLTERMRIDDTGLVGINTSGAAWRLVVNENAGYSSRAANSLPVQVAIQSGNSGYLKMGNYYTGGVGTCSTIQSTDFFYGADHGVPLLLNPLGGSVGIGEDTPNFTLVARYTGSAAQISARYNGTVPSDYKELQIGYNGATGNGYGWIQAVANGVAYTPLSLNPNGGNVGVSTTGPLAKFHVLETSGADDVIFQRSGSGGTSDSIKIANDGTVSTITGDNEEFKINHSVGTYQYFKGGNVGIGKTDPQEKLDMSTGKIRFYSSTDYQNIFANTWGINVFTNKLTGSGLRIGEIYGNLGLYSGDGATAYHLGLYAPTGYNVYLAPNNAVSMTLDSNGNVVAGATSALSTSATNGFFYLRTCAGTPTGVPTAYSGHVAMLYDTTNNKLWCYNGAWKGVVLS